MAGEITNVTVAAAALNRQAVNVTVDHTDPNTWGTPPSGEFLVEVQVNGGGFTTPANLSVFNNPCVQTEPNPIAPGGLANTVFSIFDPAWPDGANIDVRVTAQPADPGVVGDTVTGSGVTATPPTSYACLTDNITSDEARMQYGTANGDLNLDFCNQDTIEWQWGEVGTGFPNTIGPNPITAPSPFADLTGLNPSTDYEYRAILRDPGGNPLPAANPTNACTFTTLAASVGSNYNEACAVPPATFVHDTQTLTRATTQGVPASETVRILLFDDAGATNQIADSGPLGAGNGGGQQWDNVFTGLTPATTYYYRTQARDGGNNPTSEGPICEVTTQPASDPNYLPDAGCTVIPPSERNTIAVAVEFDDLPIVENAEVLVEHNINGGGFVAVPPAQMYVAGVQQTANPTPVGLASNVWDVFGYAPGDSVEYRLTYVQDGVPTQDVTTCGPETTRDVPTLDCDTQNITETSADVPFDAPFPEGYNAQDAVAPDQPDNRDTLRVRWGTVSGGPYPNTEEQVNTSSAGGTVPITGLTAGTDYFYVMELVDAGGNVVASSAECSFTTAGAVVEPEPPGVPDPNPPGTIPADCVTETTDTGDPAAPSTSVDDECLTDDNGVFFRRVVDDGAGNLTVTTVDVAGNPYAPVGTVGPCSPAEQAAADPDAVEAHAVNLATGEAWTPGANVGGTLLAVSVTATAGTVTVVDANGDSTTVPTGATLSWSVNEDENTLTGPQSITADNPGGAALVAWTERP